MAQKVDRVHSYFQPPGTTVTLLRPEREPVTRPGLAEEEAWLQDPDLPGTYSVATFGSDQLRYGKLVNWRYAVNMSDPDVAFAFKMRFG